MFVKANMFVCLYNACVFTYENDTSISRYAKLKNKTQKWWKNLTKHHTDRNMCLYIPINVHVSVLSIMMHLL